MLQLSPTQALLVVIGNLLLAGFFYETEYFVLAVLFLLFGIGLFGKLAWVSREQHLYLARKKKSIQLINELAREEEPMELET